MNTQSPFNASEERAWQALGSVENHPQVDQWLAEADVLVQTSVSHRANRWRWSVAAAAGVVAIAIGLLGYWHSAPVRYQTLVGEQRDVTLPDGSRMTLNTNSLVEVRYSKDRRLIELRQGEALFAVKPDATRPFDVEAGGASTRALGTEFNVDLRGPKVTVSVLEGAVSVVPSGVARSQEVVRPANHGRVPESALAMAALSKGQAVEFRKDDGRMHEVKADLRRIDSWRMRRLEFSDTPLTEAIDEVNRYSTLRVVAGSPDLSGVRVSGVFRIGDADGFLYSLREALKLETHEAPGEVIVMRQAQ